MKDTEMDRLNLNLKKRKLLIAPAAMAVVILLYLYLGYFFQTGVDYYGAFLREDPDASTSVSRLYTGKTEAGKTSVMVTRMSQADRLVEISVEGNAKEYVLEASSDGREIRIFDEVNTNIYRGTLSVDNGTLTDAEGEAVSYYTLAPKEDATYNVENPDPMLLVLVANRLNERYRGNVTLLFFAGLILLSMILDMIFPDLFFRMKNLRYKGNVEVPDMYRKMQKLSWYFSPLVVILLLFMAL